MGEALNIGLPYYSFQQRGIRMMHYDRRSNRC